jgi:hypothetical protein
MIRIPSEGERSYESDWNMAWKCSYISQTIEAQLPD